MEHREVCVLAQVDALRYAEIAEILGIPVGTVKSRMHGAVREVREALRREGSNREPPASVPLFRAGALPGLAPLRPTRESAPPLRPTCEPPPPPPRPPSPLLGGSPGPPGRRGARGAWPAARLGDRERRALEERLRRDPALAAEAQALATLLARARAAHEVPPDGGEARRLALSVQDRVADEEEAQARRDVREGAGSRGLKWAARILALSVAAHVVLLGVLTFRLFEDEAEPERTVVRAAFTTRRPSGTRRPPWRDPRPGWAALAAPRPPDDAPLQPGRPAPGGDEADALLPLLEHEGDHPPSLALEMITRREVLLKRRQLDRYGLDGKGTLEWVARGLSSLDHRQKADGSFPPGGGRTALGQTGLALLPFLAEGHGSRTGELGPRVVARGSRGCEAGSSTSRGGPWGPWTLRSPTWPWR